MAEDLSTYTEVDSNGYLTVTSTKVTCVSMLRDVDTFVYDDKGVAHFSGDFTHWVDVQSSGDGNGNVGYPWVMANIINDIVSIAGADGFYVTLTYKTGPLLDMLLYEIDGGTAYNDSSTGLSDSTTYYLEIERDEAVGTYGTIYCRIYSNIGRTTLVDTMTVTLHSSKKDFRYIYAWNGLNTGSAANPFSGFGENLNLDPLGIEITPTEQIVATSIPTATAKIDVKTTPVAQEVATSIPPATAKIDLQAIPIAQEVATSIPPATTEISVQATPAEQILAASIPPVTAKIELVASPVSQDVGVSIPPPTFLISGPVVVTPDVLSVAVSIPVPTVLGGEVVIPGSPVFTGPPQQGDVNLFQTNDDGDIIVERGLVEMTGRFGTSAYLSLFGGNEDDDGSQNNPFGWWGNIGEVDPAERYISETQNLLQALPASSANLRRVEDAARRDLQWFLDKNVANTLTVVVSIPAINRLKIVINIKAEGEEESFEFIENWKAAA